MTGLVEYDKTFGMKALILAGGFAKRLWPLTLDKAKPLLPIAGRPVVSHIVENIPSGIPIIVSTNATFADDFTRWREGHANRDITIAVEPSEDEGTKKGALAAVALVIKEHGPDEDWLVVGGDNFFTFSIAEFLANSEGKPMLAVHDIEDRELAKKFGIVVTDGKRVTKFVEKPADPPSTLAGTGCYHFPADVIPMVLEAAELTPDKLGAVFEHLLKNNVEVHAVTLPGYWNDIGSFEAYLDAHVQSGADLDIPGELLDEALGNTFEGVNHIDPSAKIVGSRISNSIVLPNAIIENSDIDSCIVDRECELVDQEISQQIVRPE